MFSLARANVKEGSVPSDMEDDKFVAQIALDCIRLTLELQPGM